MSLQCLSVFGSNIMLKIQKETLISFIFPTDLIGSINSNTYTYSSGSVMCYITDNIQN